MSNIFIKSKYIFVLLFSLLILYTCEDVDKTPPTVSVSSHSSGQTVGETLSFGSGKRDIFLIKTDVNGNQLWFKTFGGEGEESAASVIQTNDGGFLITGSTESFGNGNNNGWLIKTDSQGNTVQYK